MLVTGAGVAGSLEGKLQSGGANFAVGGTLVLRFNNTGLAVDTTVLVGDELVGLSFANDQNVYAVTLGGFTLDIGGVVTIEGDVTFTSQGDYNVFAGENMTLFVGEGPLNKDGARNPDAKGLLVSDATIGLVKKDGKYALSAEGQVSVVGISGLSLSGPISISYNGFNQLVDEAVAIAGTAKQVAVKFVNDQVATAQEAFYEIKGFETPIAIDVAGQRVRANFSVRRFASAGSDKDDSLEFGLTNVVASFGDGTSNFVTLSGGSGTLLSMPNGVALEASGSVSVSAPQVSLSGDMKLKINNVKNINNEGVAVNQGSVNLPAGPYTKFEGTGLNLVIAEQTLEGDFIFEKDSNGDVSGAVTNGAIIISDSSSIPNQLISLSGISGGFEMSSEGSYGALQVGGSTFTVPGVSLSGGNCDGADEYGG